MLDWLTWARETFGFTNLTWAGFYLTNAVMVVVAIAAAAIGWRSPEIALTLPALFVINALFFHLLPTIRDRRFSPGLITALVVYLPVAAWTYLAADVDGVLSVKAVVVSTVLGAAFMAYPIVLIRLQPRLAARTPSG